MRRRNSGNNASNMASNNNNKPITKHNSTMSNSDSSDESDPEEGIQVSHPNDDEDGLFLRVDRVQHDLPSLLVQELLQGKAWWVQGLTIALSTLLTYAMTNHAPTNVQIAIMTVISLFGASPFCSTHLIPAAIGTFVGGHSLFVDNDNLGMQYLWLLVLSLSVTLVWSFVITRFRILDGCAGRLGTTTFIGMNLATFCLLGPLGVVPWNLYVYGFVDWVHAGEAEDHSSSTQQKLAMAWTWIEEAQVAIGYVAAVVWLSVIAGGTRLYHHHYYSQTKSPTPPPLNNVLIPVLWALLSMMLVTVVRYEPASSLYNGFAVGSYIAMASLQKIPSITKFATVGLVAALWGLLLTPLVVGFAGKSGFTSMLGHITHDALERAYTRFLARRQQLEREQQEQQQQQQQQSERDQQQRRRQEEQLLPPPPPAAPSTTPTPKRKSIHKEVYYTKQQRRQQQRLQHLHQQHQQSPLLTPQQQQQQQQPQQQQLHHRAWSALPKHEDSAWQHPMLESAEDP